MKRDYLLGVLFFGSLWGFSEASLGGWLYKDYSLLFLAPVPLTVIGFMILTVAKIYFPQKHSATLIGSVAMLYKFLNMPFFACHLLAIFLLGLSYDLVFNFFKKIAFGDDSKRDSSLRSESSQSLSEAKGRFSQWHPVYTLTGTSIFLYHKIKSKAVLGLVASYLGFILFALTITYVFRYRFWIEEGLPRILRYVGISGTLTAAANFVFVPVSFKLGRMLKEGLLNPFEFKSRLATGSVSLITLTIWVLGIARCF